MFKTKKVTKLETTVQLDSLEVKRVQLAYLQEESTYAIQMFTETIQKIKSVNDEIEMAEKDIDETILELTKTRLELETTQTANSHLIANFESLLK